VLKHQALVPVLHQWSSLLVQFNRQVCSQRLEKTIQKCELACYHATYGMQGYHSPDEIAGNVTNICALLNLNYPQTLRIKVQTVSYFVELWACDKFSRLHKFPDLYPTLGLFPDFSQSIPDFFQVSRNSRKVVTLEWPKKILPSSVQTLCRNNEDITLHICDNFSHRSSDKKGGGKPGAHLQKKAQKNKPGSSWTTRKVLATVLICMREYVNWLRFTCILHARKHSDMRISWSSWLSYRHSKVWITTDSKMPGSINSER